jgi:hypothetical protein
MAPTSPTNGGRSVGVLWSRTKATEFKVVFITSFHIFSGSLLLVVYWSELAHNGHQRRALVNMVINHRVPMPGGSSVAAQLAASREAELHGVNLWNSIRMFLLLSP